MSQRHPGPPLGLVVPRVAELTLLDALVAAEWEGCFVRLLDGSVTPGLGDTTYTYLQHTPSWPGYGPQVATGWGSASIGTDSYAVVSGPAVSWTFNAAYGPIVVGGVWITDTAGALLGAELIPTGPVTLIVTGQVLPYQPQVSLRSVYPAVDPYPYGDGNDAV